MNHIVNCDAQLNRVPSARVDANHRWIPDKSKVATGKYKIPRKQKRQRNTLATTGQKKATKHNSTKDINQSTFSQGVNDENAFCCLGGVIFFGGVITAKA